jgi:hypothetical protein
MNDGSQKIIKSSPFLLNYYYSVEKESHVKRNRMMGVLFYRRRSVHPLVWNLFCCIHGRSCTFQLDVETRRNWCTTMKIPPTVRSESDRIRRTVAGYQNFLEFKVVTIQLRWPWKPHSNGLWHLLWLSEGTSKVLVLTGLFPIAIDFCLRIVKY